MRRVKIIGPLEVTVTDDLERAIKILKKKMALEGLYKELKKRRHYEQPSIRERRKREEAERRRRKNLKKKRF
jgi:small subunit ribosomal protein S21